MSADKRYPPEQDYANNPIPYELTDLARVEIAIQRVESKLDAILATVQGVYDKVDPLIDQIAKHPFGKMMGLGK